MSKKYKIEIKNTNLKSIQVYHIKTDDKELKYFKSVNKNIRRSYSEKRDENINKLIPEVEITKLVFLEYFDTQ